MKVAGTIIRILLGALLIFASVSYFMNMGAMPVMEGDIGTFMTGLMASHYLFPLVKAVELICGIAFVFGLYIPLVSIVFFPISLNIFLIHLFLEPADLPIAIFVLGANLYLAYLNRDKYKALFN